MEVYIKVTVCRINQTKLCSSKKANVPKKINEVSQALKSEDVDDCHTKWLVYD